MPIPHVCPNPSCPYHRSPPRRWKVHFGHYDTIAHGTIKRYRCRSCARTFSDQTESLHYYAKRHLPLHAITISLLGGASMREVARRYRVSPMAIHNAVLRIARQAMAAHITLLEHLSPRSAIAFDGLRSCITSQDYPCDITTVVDRRSETILSMNHAVFHRGGAMRPTQRRRLARKKAVWNPPKGCVSRAISLTYREIWDYLRPAPDAPATIDTDENPLYRSVFLRDTTARHFRKGGLLRHIQTPGSAPRTFENRLFPVNYVDRLVRHRMKEHTRETIAIGRHATMQMSRAWIFAWDHNCRRLHRVKQPYDGVHALHGCVSEAVVRRIEARFYTRRITVADRRVPDSIAEVWMGKIITPPVRWKAGQKGTSVRIPSFAVRDLGVGVSTVM